MTRGRILRRARLREEQSFAARIILGSLCIAAILGIWMWATAGEIVEERVLSPTIMPSPFEVWASMGALADRGLVAGIAATLKRVFLGFGLSISVGVTTGILAGSWRPFQAFMAPVVLFGRSLPLAALIPMTVFWFGIEDQQKIMFIFIATVPFIFSDTVASVLSVNERYVETAETLGASRIQIIFKVLVPLSLPDIFTSIRFLFGLAFGYVMLAEVINAGAGLGFLINQSFSRGANMEHAILLLLIIGFMAYVIDRTLVWFQRGLFPYRKDL
ncbi:MAG: ABC transporter permease [Myxococcales bacterium]|nr:ABC transporter permease [Myxococcales bacterium]